MILNTHRDRSPRLARSRLGFFTTATAMLAVLAINAGPRLVLAQSPTDIAAAPALVNDAPPSPVADGAPAALPSDGPGAESGPRSKSVSYGYGYAAGASSSQSAPPSPAYPPAPALPPAAPLPGVAPAPPAPPSARIRRKYLTVEERLDRLERILEDPEAHDGGKGRHHSSDSLSLHGGPNGSGVAVGVQTDMSVQPDLSADLDFKRAADEARKVAEEAKRAVEAGERVAEAGERAAEVGQRNAEQAMRNLAKLKNKDFERMQENLSALESEAPIKALQALRDAHQSLESQLRNIDRQIKQLEEDQNRPKKPAHVRPDDADDGPKPGQPAPEKTL